jgi:alkanesulfonate monooxygenase
VTSGAISAAVLIEPQLGLDYHAQLAAARAAEAHGFDAFYRSDHYGTTFPIRHPVVTDAWTVLAGIARQTRRIRLGTLVSPVTFRHVGALAAVVATAQHMSHGRVELGLGTGWDEAEHDAFGIPFPSLGARMRLLEQQARELRELWARNLAAIAAPVIVGGRGGARSRGIAVRHADGYNVLRASPTVAATVNGLLDEECREAGRDPRTLRRSVLLGTLIGEDALQYRQRRDALGHILGLGDGVGAWLDERREFWALGLADELRTAVSAYLRAGCDQVVLEVFDGRDLEMVKLAGQVLRSME